MCVDLKEFTFKQLRAAQDDPNFLRSAERVRQLQKAGQGTEYVGLRGMSVWFRTKSSEHADNGIVYTQEVVLLDLPEALMMQGVKMKDKALKAMRGDVMVRCDCPAFLYWGFAYINLQLDSGASGQYYGGWSEPGRTPTKPGTYPEDRGPDGGLDGNPPYYIGRRRRNWKLRNQLCKHLMVVQQVFIGHWNSLVADLKKQGYE